MYAMLSGTVNRKIGQGGRLRARPELEVLEGRAVMSTVMNHAPLPAHLMVDLSAPTALVRREVTPMVIQIDKIGDEVPALTRQPRGEEVPALTRQPRGEEVPALTRQPRGEEVPALTRQPRGEEVPALTLTPRGEEVPALTRQPRGEEVPALTGYKVGDEIPA